MKSIIIEKVINGSLSEVWNTWDNFGDIYLFHPGVEKSYLLGGSAQSGKGAKRRCNFVGGKNFILEELVEYNPQKSFTQKIYDGNIPVKYAYVTFVLQPLGESRTKVTVSVEFKMKFGLFGKLLIPVMRKQLETGIAALLDGNAEFVEKQMRVAA